ncbi:hypothetical protein TrRE_jg126, partial [Triparma retinervis]
LPSWLPPGDAVLRWDWSALHTYPNVEFYSQCSDILISSVSSFSPSDLGGYSIVSPPIYPPSGVAGVGFRNPFDPQSDQFVTGPPCAMGYTGNGCDLTNLHFRTELGKSCCEDVDVTGTRGGGLQVRSDG